MPNIKNIIIEDGLSIVQQRGCGQYTLRIYEVLKSITHYNVELKRKPFLENIKNSVLRRILYILWLNTVFVFLLYVRNGITKKTICIFTSVVTPIIKVKNIEYISVLHDIRAVLYPELSSKIQNVHIRFANWSCVKFSDKIITVSETSKQDIEKHYRIDSNKIVVVYNTSSIQNVKTIDENSLFTKYDIEKEKYLFFVGGLDKNKNVQLIIDAFNIICQQNKKIKLVIAGSRGNSKIDIDSNNIVLTGFISNEEIKQLYKYALIYLFPSQYEGFGIPIIDAQTMSCPVVCSDIPIFHEVGKDSVMYSEIEKFAFAHNINNLINDEKKRKKLIELGINNAHRFSQEIVKKQLIEVIEN